MFNFFKKKSSEEKDKLNTMIKSSVEAFKNRPIYEKLTKEIIDSTEDNDLNLLIFDTISTRLRQSLKEQLDEIKEKELNVGQKALYSVWFVETEVNNGGFNQFYWNSSMVFSEMAVDGFRTFGAIKFAELMGRANKLYSSIKPDLENNLDRSMESFSKSYEDNPLNDLDKEFYDLYSKENLNKLRIDYIRTHINEFI